MTTNNTSTSRLGPIIENIEKLTRLQRIAIYVAVLVVIIGAAVWFSFKPKIDDIGKLKNQLVQVQAELAKAKKNASELNDWRSKMKKKEAKYRTVMRALPEKEEIPSLLEGISKAGKDAGLEFILFQPKPESTKQDYTEIPVDMNVSGTYHEVAVFFDKVANLPRIVNIRDIKMTPASKDGGGNDLVTSCQAVTYKFVESAGQAQGRRGTNQRNRRK
jgi:type IV pilus assembly protein PilO